MFHEDPELNSEYRQIVHDHCHFYCLCYKDPVRESHMKHTFHQLDLPLTIFGGVEHTDSRIADNDVRQTSSQLKRLHSCTWGHLDMIRMFYESYKTYGFFCEYDVVFRKDFPQQLPTIFEDFDSMNLDILLMGYMISYDLEPWMSGYGIYKDIPNRLHRYHHYPNEQWGVHGYLLNRRGAKKILDTYTEEYMNRTLSDPTLSFSPDWTVSKIQGNRALMYPMLCCEDGSDGWEHYKHDGQYHFHLNTFLHNYIPGVFLPPPRIS